MKALNKILFIGIAAVMTGCSATTYIPTQQTVTLFEEKGEAVVSVHLSDPSKSYLFGPLGISAAYAVSDHFAVQGNSFISGIGTPSQWELGFGHFCSLKKGLVLENYVGVGRAKERFARKNEFVYNRLWWQTSLGYRSDYFECALSARLSQLNYKSDFGNNFLFGEQTSDFYNDRLFYAIEPSGLIRAGLKNVKLQLQYNAAFEISDHGLPMKTPVANVGIFVRIPLNN